MTSQSEHIHKEYQSIKSNITSLKNKIFSFFKIKKNKNISIHNEPNTSQINTSQVSKHELNKNQVNKNQANKNQANKNQLNKNLNDYNDKDMNNTENSINCKDIQLKPIEPTEPVELDEEEITKIHSSFLLNNIIDRITTNTYGSCDNKKYVKNISEFYISNEDYYSYKNILPFDLYYEFSVYVNALLNKNIPVIHNLRSVKLYEDDMGFCNCHTGVFKTDNFIIKIDTDSFNFKNEITSMYNIGKGLVKDYNVVLPIYVKIHSKNKKIINFSFQPRIHNTISLRDWLLIYENQNLCIEFYIKLCIQICKSIEFIHSKHIVHGDIKPDNILIDVRTNIPYIIDFGLSGLHGLSEGTGGTKPFCHPNTLNINGNTSNSDYFWVKNEKKNDIWSISFIFASILIFRRCYSNYKDFPYDFFDDNKYVNINYINYIPKQYRKPFIFTLVRNNIENNIENNTPNIQNTDLDVDLDIQNFIFLLEKSLK